MATYTITTPQNIDELASKAGGDTYNINGGTLTVDQDSRVGTNQNTSATLGAVTVSSTLGGSLKVDARKVRMIPFNSGSGNVPAWNTLITQGGASGKLIGVHSSLTAASTATGAAMPASGYLRVKQWNDVAYAAGALTGIGASATGPDVVGWIEIVGDDANTITANRLGTMEFLGEWFEIGTTSGASNQTMQIPNNGLLRHIAGVYIEKTVGGGDFEFYPNAGTVTSIGTEAARGKVVWVDNTGLVRIGNHGAGTSGYTPVSGLRVVIGNIFLECCTTAARTANVIPNATAGTRYEFATTGGGVVSLSKVNCAWYGNFSQAYSLTMTDVGFVDLLALAEMATPTNLTRVGVGNKAVTAYLITALQMTNCFAGGTFTDCVWQRVSLAASGNSTAIFTDIDGFTFVRNTFRANTAKANSNAYTLVATRPSNCTFTDCVEIQGMLQFITGLNITVTNLVHIEMPVGTTVSTYSTYAVHATSGSNNIMVNGLTLPVTNNHPYAGLVYFNAGSINCTARNIGTRVAPLNLGSVNACAYAYVAASAASKIKIQRVYVSNTRNGFASLENACRFVTQENCAGDYADTADPLLALNMRVKGWGGTGSITAQAAVYESNWRDVFISTTAGRLHCLMNESASVVRENGANFTSSGSLYMPTVGMAATFEMDYYALGHTAFTNSALVMGGGTVANYRFEYAIDVNDGNGFSAMTNSAYTAAALATALNGVTLDASKGFKLKLKISTTTGNTSTITSVYLLTDSTASAQDYQYPLDTANVTITGLVAGTEIHAYRGIDPATCTEIATTESSGASFVFSQSFGGESGYITLVKPGLQFLKIPITYATSDVSIPVFQNTDRAYSNP